MFRTDYNSKPMFRNDYNSKPMFRTDYNSKLMFRTDYNSKPLFRTDYNSKPLFRNDYNSKPMFRTDSSPKLNDVLPVLEQETEVKLTLKQSKSNSKVCIRRSSLYKDVKFTLFVLFYNNGRARRCAWNKKN